VLKLCSPLEAWFKNVFDTARVAIPALALGAVLFLTGCGDPAVSVRPLYVAGEKPVAEPLLGGQWVTDDASSGETQNWIVTAQPDGCYQAEIQSLSSDSKKDTEKEDTRETYRACLVRLQDKLFFDSELLFKNFGRRTVRASDLGQGVTANHLIGRLWVDKDLLRLVRLKAEWVSKDTPEEFREMRGQSALITGSTDRLRQIVAEHADDPGTWTSAVYLCRPSIDCKLHVIEDKLARSPNDADVLEEAGAFYLSRGDYGKGLSLMRRAVDLKPNEASTHGYLALALGYQRDFEGARSQLAVAQKLDKELGYQFFIGLSYYLEGKYPEASREFAAFRAGRKDQVAAAILFQYFAMLRAGHTTEGKAMLARETEHFTGTVEDQLLLLQASGRVTDPTWGQLNEDAEGDVILMYAENCLVQGDTKAARAAFKYVLRKPGDDPVNELATRIELDRLDGKAKEGK
jgi:tetratricopeptide (TPR) repeat protein